MSLQKLDEIQLAAVTSEDENILCNSKAGSGKTRILMNRCLWLMENGIKPEEILLVTFTNKAAKEMMTRITSLSPDGYKITCGTFHSISLYFLRLYSEEAGYDDNFSVISTEDCKTKLKSLIKSFAILKKDDEINDEKTLSAQNLLKHYSAARNLGTDFETYLLQKCNYTYGNAALAKEIMEFYQDSKIACNQMDFDDILENFQNLLYNDEIREEITSRYKHIMVDEYQDINSVQNTIINLLKNNNKNLFVVGDPYQCIYEFRGSKIEFIDNFSEIFESQVFEVNNNYRSTQNILDTASMLIGSKIVSKSNLEDYNEEVDLYLSRNNFDQINKIVRLIDYKINKEHKNPRDIAVLVRTTIELFLLEQSLNQSGIPYELRAGFSYFERSHIKDILSVLTILVNRKDKDALKRTLKMFNGFGEKTIDKCIEYISKNNLSINEFVNHANEGKIKLNKKTLEGIKDVEKVFSNIDVSYTIEKNINEILNNFYQKYLVETYDDYFVRTNDVLNLKTLSKEYDKKGEPNANTLSEFIRDSIIDTTENDGTDEDSKKEKIIISTIHRAKGLEWDDCIICNLDPRFEMKNKNDEDEEDTFELSEDRRLLYVGITRAKKKLDILANVQSYNTNRKNKVNLSYLLKELELPYKYC